jgi:hypothetical protein
MFNSINFSLRDYCPSVLSQRDWSPLRFWPSRQSARFGAYFTYKDPVGKYGFHFDRIY